MIHEIKYEYTNYFILTFYILYQINENNTKIILNNENNV